MTSVLTVMLLGLMMVTSSFVFMEGLQVYAKDDSGGGSKDSGGGGNGDKGGDSGSSSGSASSDSGSSSGGSSDSHSGSDSKDTSADSQATPSNPDPDKDGDNDLKKTAVQATTETGTTPVTQGPVAPVGPIVPIPTIKGQTPDKGCAFHPESPKCMPDKDGNCPSGFSHNSKGNCFPSGPCPGGFGRDDNDESGKCFAKSPQCPHGFHMMNGHCNKDITITVHTHNSGSSPSGSSYSLSDSCYNEIKLAWIGKIQRGQNSEVDSIIDKCMGL